MVVVVVVLVVVVVAVVVVVGAAAEAISLNTMLGNFLTWRGLVWLGFLLSDGTWVQGPKFSKNWFFR